MDNSCIIRHYNLTAEELKEVFAATLKNLRKTYTYDIEYEHGFDTFTEQISQEILSKKSGIALDTIKKWESKRCLPGLDSLVKLADCFRVPIDALICRSYAGTVSNKASKNMEEWCNSKQGLQVFSDFMEAAEIMSTILILSGRCYPPLGETLLFDNYIFSDSEIYDMDFKKEYDRKKLHDMIDKFLDEENEKLRQEKDVHGNT